MMLVVVNIRVTLVGHMDEVADGLSEVKQSIFCIKTLRK